MEELLQQLNEADRRKLSRFSTAVTVTITILTLLSFWAGVDYLRENVFKHYFNPSRHIIVEQDPDTMEIYTWKDALGNVYDTNDPDVKRFPYGVMFLILLVLGVATQSYSLLVEHYVIMLIVKNQAALAQSSRLDLFRGMSRQVPTE